MHPRNQLICDSCLEKLNTVLSNDSSKVAACARPYRLLYEQIRVLRCIESFIWRIIFLLSFKLYNLLGELPAAHGPKRPCTESWEEAILSLPIITDTCYFVEL